MSSYFHVTLVNLDSPTHYHVRCIYGHELVDFAKQVLGEQAYSFAEMDPNNFDAMAYIDQFEKQCCETWDEYIVRLAGSIQGCVFERQLITSVIQDGYLIDKENIKCFNSV